jgi:cytidylate kinase
MAAQPRPMPLITFQRQHGSRGAVVARLVAERLGYTCWDRELVAAIAVHLQVDASELTPLDEHRRETGEALAATAASRVGHADYVRGLQAVAQTLTRRGSAVVVGRGVGFLLGADDCLRVRVVAPLEQRVAGLAGRSQLSLETARATIEYVERDRQAFIREQHGCDVEDPTSYDLVVSTGTMAVETAADVIVAAYQARFGARRWPRATVGPSPSNAAWSRPQPRTMTNR